MGKKIRFLILGLSAVAILPFVVFPPLCFSSTGNLTLREQINQELLAKDGVFRKRTLLEYLTSANEKNEISLRNFTGDEDAAAGAIGKDKSILVLHQLRLAIGEQAFSGLARDLPGASLNASSSWDDIRRLCEKETGRDLGWFFQQWVDRKGLPDLRVENATVQRNGSMFELSFDLLQTGDLYTLDVPVLISFLRGGSKSEMIRFDTAKKHVVLLTDEMPSVVTVDRNYDIPRRLSDAEIPPLLMMLLRDEKQILVLPLNRPDIYSDVIRQWKQRGFDVKNAADISDRDVKTSSLLVLGADNPLLGRLYGKMNAGEGTLNAQARKNPWNSRKIVVALEAKTASNADVFMHLLSESGGCSNLSQDAAGSLAQSTAESDKGIVMELREEPLAVNVATLKTLQRVIDDAAGKKIIYVGEYHDRFAHHEVELEVIKSLYRKNREIAIGMEMFQRPFQQVLDDYINGTIEEREFLKKSEYFSRWSYDYNLYKPILDFARAKKIPVIALNLRREITDKVSRDGMDSLTVEQKKEIPNQLDFSDDEYREKLLKIFAQHKGSSERNFDFFYQSQVLWDETMAMSIDEYLQKNPDRRMIVIAGQGHFAYGSGIPRRTFRRNDYPYVMLLNDVDLDREVADYVFFPEPLEGVTTPKLGVLLKDSNGEIMVADMPDESAARESGIKAGDRILALDGVPVQTSDDIKIALFYKKRDDRINVTIIRSRFLLGEREMHFDVNLH